MEIQDMDGKKIISLTPGKSKGLNVVEWYYTIKAPKVAKAKTFSFGGFASPRVKAGKYKAVITKGKDTFEHVFEVANDPKSSLSNEDIELKHQSVMKLYNLSEELAYIIYKLDTVVGICKKTKTKQALTSLKKTLVVTTGDNYVGSAEPQLREKIAELYSKIVSSYDKPSAAELDYLAVLANRFDSSKLEFEKLVKKAKVKKVEFKSFEDFIK